LLVRAKHFVWKWTRWVTRQSMLVRVLIGLAGLVLAVAAIVLTWWLYRLL